MRALLLLLCGAAVGYVFGARAGREKYDQMVESAEKLWNQPSVQAGVGKVTDFARERGGPLGAQVADSVQDFVGRTTSDTDGAEKSA